MLVEPARARAEDGFAIGGPLCASESCVAGSEVAGFGGFAGLLREDVGKRLLGIDVAFVEKREPVQGARVAVGLVLREPFPALGERTVGLRGNGRGGASREPTKHRQTLVCEQER